jgi:hypothetical protein
MNRYIVLALVGLAGCSQNAGNGEVSSGPVLFAPAPSVYGLIGERERLELTSDQVEALDSIGNWLATENRKLEKDLDDKGIGVAVLLADTLGEVNGRRVSDAALETVEKYRSAHDSASDGVEALLTVEQRAEVCRVEEELSRSRAADRRRQRWSSVMGQSMWKWCVTEPETSAQAD